VSCSEVKALANGNPLLIDKARPMPSWPGWNAPNATSATFSEDGERVLRVRHEHLATPIVNTVTAVRFRA
jgi:hypothetical protein